MPDALVGGARVRYELEGPEGGELVALLNGIAMSIGHWKPVAAALAAAGYRVLSHDFRGQLLSDRSAREYSLEGHARDLAELLCALGAGSARLVGTSYGAEVGLCFARDYPALTRSLVVVSAAAEYDAVLGAAIESWRAAALGDPTVFYKSILPWSYSAAWLDANRAALARRAAEVAALPRDWFESFAGLCEAFLRMDFAGSLGSIRAPCLAVAAGADILKPPRYSRAIAEGIPRASYAEVPLSGHAVAVERPVEVAGLAVDFMLAH